MESSMTWGQKDARSAQGYMYRTLDRRYWYASWSDFWDTLQRDGAIRHNTETNELASENRRIVIYPYAITDDFGQLVAVKPRTFIGGEDREPT